MIDRITTRRAALAAQLARGRLAFADLEAQRDQAIRDLAELQRQLDGMAGGIQELDALLDESAEPAEPAAPIIPYATGLAPAHEAALEGGAALGEPTP